MADKGNAVTVLELFDTATELRQSAKRNGIERLVAKLSHVAESCSAEEFQHRAEQFLVWHSACTRKSAELVYLYFSDGLARLGLTDGPMSPAFSDMLTHMAQQRFSDLSPEHAFVRRAQAAVMTAGDEADIAEIGKRMIDEGLAEYLRRYDEMEARTDASRAFFMDLPEEDHPAVTAVAEIGTAVTMMAMAQATKDLKEKKDLIVGRPDGGIVEELMERSEELAVLKVEEANIILGVEPATLN